MKKIKTCPTCGENRILHYCDRCGQLLTSAIGTTYLYLNKSNPMSVIFYRACTEKLIEETSEWANPNIIKDRQIGIEITTPCCEGSEASE